MLGEPLRVWTGGDRSRLQETAAMQGLCLGFGPPELFDAWEHVVYKAPTAMSSSSSVAC